MTKLPEWTSGQDTENKELIVKLPMRLTKTKTKKGKEFLGLAQIGSAFGGDCIGTDDKGRQVMLKTSVYLKEPSANTSSKSMFSIGS